jgi:hypothetical protein
MWRGCEHAEQYAWIGSSHHSWCAGAEDGYQSRAAVPVRWEEGEKNAICARLLSYFSSGLPPAKTTSKRALNETELRRMVVVVSIPVMKPWTKARTRDSPAIENWSWAAWVVHGCFVILGKRE